MAFAIDRLPSRSAEPAYQRRTVTDWLNKLAAKGEGYDPDEPEIRAIFAIGPPAVPYLRQALREGDTVSDRAIKQIGARLGQRLTPQIAVRPATYYSSLRMAASQCLAVIGPPAREAIPDLINCLDDRRASGLVDYAILQIGIGKEHLPIVLDRLNSSTNLSGQSGLLSQLGKIGGEDVEAIRVLVRTARGTNQFLAERAIAAIGETQSRAPEILRTLRHSLTNKNVEIRIGAALSLRKIFGPTADSTVWLANALEAQTKTTSFSARSFLDMREISILFILEAVRDDTNKISSLMATVRKLTDSPKIQIRMSAAHALWKMTGETNRIVEILEAGLSDRDHNVRRRAAKSLHEFCTKERFRAAILAQMMNYSDLATRVFGAAALWKFDGASERIVSILTEGLRDHFTYYDNIEIRRVSASALGEMGSDAKGAAEVLAEAIHDSDANVRNAARGSLKTLRK